MKKLACTCILVIAGFLFTNAYAQPAKPAPVEKPKQLVEVPDSVSNAKLTHGTVVPSNQTYNVYDENGNLLGTYTEGKTVIVPATKGKKKMDCAIIPCPKTFKKGTTCWKCK